MKNKIKNNSNKQDSHYRLNKLLFLLPLFLWIGCLDDREEKNPFSPDENITPEVVLSVSIPGVRTSSTRSLSEADESTLESVNIFVFRDNGPGNEETYLYHTHATDITGKDNQWNFKVYLQKSEEDVYHRIVLLANLRNEVEEADRIYGFNDLQTKEEVLSSITFLSDVPWRTTDPVRTLPMWGQSDTTYLITGKTKGTDLPTLYLMRSVARIDIGVNLTSSDQPQPLNKNKFILKDVYLYHVKDKGAVAPLDSCYNGSGGEELKGIVTKPSIPLSANRVSVPVHYTQDNPSNVFFRDIYLSEADNIAAGKNAVSMVIGGYFTPEGEPENLSQLSYYRIDFYDTSKTIPEQFDLLRNHRYRINILAIHAEGYENKEKAIQEPPINIDTEIEVNEEGVIQDVVYDGQHYLGVNNALFELSGNEWNEYETSVTNLLVVNTTYPDGWKISGITDINNNLISDWLKVSQNNGIAKTQTPVRLLLTENRTGEARSGYIHLEAGQLQHKVLVNQSFRNFLSVKDGNGVEIPNGGTFYYESGVMGSIPAQILDLEWSPGDVEVLLEEGINPFTFDSSDDLLTNGDLFTGGNKTLNIRAALMQPAEYNVNPFLIKETKVTFLVTGTTLSRTIILKQEKKGIVEDACFYPLDGGDYNFTVKSNTTWNVTLTNNDDGIIDVLQTSSGGNNTEGETIHFKMNKVNTEYEGTAILTFTSPLNEFPDEIITIRGGTGKVVNPSNSYIIHPGTIGIRIPVSRANEHTNRMGEADAIHSSDILTAELLWTDNPNGISCESNIASVAVMGSGSAGYIQVWPGSVEGNALVAVKVNGIIKWSWHIWITRYNPGNGFITHNNGKEIISFMDRNLGALSNLPGDPLTIGFHYQWGRKDPIPGAASFAQAIYQSSYNAKGEKINIPSDYINPLQDHQTLAWTIANPTDFVLPYSSYGYWYATNIRDLTLWGRDDSKTIYDPCPEGWRIPNSGPSTSSYWYSPQVGLTYEVSEYKGEWNYGWDFNDPVALLGYYPAAGGRTGRSVSSVGSKGLYWTADLNGRYASGMDFDRYDISVSFAWEEGYGFSVRCVKE